MTILEENVKNITKADTIVQKRYFMPAMKHIN